MIAPKRKRGHYDFALSSTGWRLTCAGFTQTLKHAMKRRRLTSLLGAATLALGSAGPGIALGAGAGKGVRRIGWLSLDKAESDLALQGRRLLYESMRRAGYDERANLIVERRYAEDDISRLTELADDIVRQDVELLIAVGNHAIAAALPVARKMPVVMLGASLPVDLGFVVSLARPGANVTGTAWVLPETAGKHLQVLKEAASTAVRVAVLSNPKSPGVQRYAAATERAARAWGMQVDTYDVSRSQDIGPALKRIVAHRMDGLYVIGDPVINPRLPDIATHALKHKLVSIGTSRAFVEAGGLLYYGPELADQVERLVRQVDRILRGARPADLPIEQPVVYELVVNLKTAHALGRTIPPPMLMRAAEVIE
jgi:putative ABC transport system substrate-binding protein